MKRTSAHVSPSRQFAGTKGGRRSVRTRCEPATADRWDDFERLFGKNGACGGCWCMFWRLTRAEFDRKKGTANRRSMRQLFRNNAVPGVLAYRGDEPIGWCAVAPRSDYDSLTRSRVLKPVDDKPVWSVSCLFVAKAHRRRGISIALLKGAVAHVKRMGGKIVEGYPVIPKSDDMPAVFAWTGTLAAFEAAGFTECVRHSETRPIMRRTVK